MRNNTETQLLLSAPVLTTRLLYWIGLGIAVVVGFFTVLEALFGDRKETLYLLGFSILSLLVSWLSTNLAQITCSKENIKISTRTAHRIVDKSSFKEVKAVAGGVMRIDFTNDKSAYFLPNTRILKIDDEIASASTVSLFKNVKDELIAHSFIASLSVNQQAALFTVRIKFWLENHG